MCGYMRRFSPAFLKMKELLENDSRPVRYIRFRDIIREGDFYIGQTWAPLRSRSLSGMPSGAFEQMKQMKYEQHSIGLGEDATEMQRNAYQMLLGLGCHTFSAVRELVGLPKEIKAQEENAKLIDATFAHMNERPDFLYECKMLADEMGVSTPKMAHVLGFLVNCGKVKRIEGKKPNFQIVKGE